MSDIKPLIAGLIAALSPWLIANLIIYRSKQFQMTPYKTKVVYSIVSTIICFLFSSMVLASYFLEGR